LKKIRELLGEVAFVHVLGTPYNHKGNFEVEDEVDESFPVDDSFEPDVS
jgi:hypothetical protein